MIVIQGAIQTDPGRTRVQTEPAKIRIQPSKSRIVIEGSIVIESN